MLMLYEHMLGLSIIGNIFCKIWSFQIFDRNIGTTDFHAKKVNFDVDVA